MAAERAGLPADIDLLADHDSSEYGAGHTSSSSSQQNTTVTAADTDSSTTFHEDEATNTFGRLTKGGKYKAYSDFRFHFTAKVKGASVSGYLLDVFPASYDHEGCESRDEALECFFTCENAHQLKQDFMKSVNHAVKGGGFLTCSFRDNEFGEFLLYKKRMCTASRLPLKTAVSHCGIPSLSK